MILSHALRVRGLKFITIEFESLYLALKLWGSQFYLISSVFIYESIQTVLLRLTRY